MAEGNRGFGFHSIVLYKSETLGTGSYGGVCKAECDGLLRAAKIIHPTMFDLRDPGTPSYLRKFEEECHLLSLARHPNVVQYLATYIDPETHLPVLLMELCDESLSQFLEKSAGSLPYHTELNISHDIASALVYLHSNGLIHRDLTGNNILMIAGVRAKVTDFGMSRLASISPRITPLTCCPGNVHYMSPQAFEEPPSYTEKLDIFSFGVLQVQIMTRMFPNPSARLQVDPQYPDANVRVIVPEEKRRSSHLQLISDTHPLKPVALHCLKDKENQRPSAQQLCRTLSKLKQEPCYVQSLKQASVHNEIETLEGLVKNLQNENKEQKKENEKCQLKIEQLETEQEALLAKIDGLEQDLQSQQLLTEANGSAVHQLQVMLEEKQKELSQNCDKILTKERELQASEHLVVQLQQTLECKDKTIDDLHHSISASKKKVHQLELQIRTMKDQILDVPVIVEVPQTSRAPVTVKDVSNMEWKEGKKAPEKMASGAAAVHGTVVYVNPWGTHKIYSCHIQSGEQVWLSLPDSRYQCFGLVIIDDLLTSVGGYRNGWLNGTRTNNLLSLIVNDQRRQWVKVFPSMPTARSENASITTDEALVVAGGYDGKRNLDVVEVMNISTKQWSRACCLPHPFGVILGAICGDQLYLVGGFVQPGQASKSVLRCSITELLQSQSLGRRLPNRAAIWKEAKELPVSRCTPVAYCGHLLAIGGKSSSDNPTADIHCYDHHSNQWHRITQMKSKKYACLAAVLSENQLLTVGGYGENYECIDSVETGTIPGQH